MPDPLPRLAAALSRSYRIERRIGAGGMATVYLAHDLKHDRQVAVKVLRPELAAVIGAERFLAEIRTTANLQHPHILPLHDSGEAREAGDPMGRPYLYYVMPYVEGESLRDRLTREKQLPIADAVRIATEVASALDYAHRHNVIHRDIKPENILLHDGRALVADFGIALAASTAGGARMTETGMNLGTPTYMSPEQAMGAREITARSDVYALGCVLYEMLIGEPPFTGPTAQSIVAKVMTEKPASLIARRDRIPAAVEEAVFTALEKLPADRFASAAEFAGALTNQPPGASQTRGRVASRALPSWRAMLAAAVGVFVLGVLADRFSGGLARPESLSFTAKTFQQQAIFNARFTHDGKTIVYSAATDAATPDLFVIRPDYPAPQPLGMPRAQLLAISSQDELAILVNPTFLVHRNFTGTLARVPVGGGAPREMLDGVRDADWSPDGAQLAIIRHVDGKDLLEYPIGKRLVEATGYLSDLRVSPDGKHVAFIQHPVPRDDRGRVAVVDLAGRMKLLTAEAMTVQGMVWAPGNDELFFSQGTSINTRTVHAVTLGGRLRTVLPGPGGMIMTDRAADGQALVTRDDQAFHVTVRRAGVAGDIDNSWLDFSTNATFSPDGSVLALADGSTWGGDHYSVMLRDADGRVARLGEGSPVAFSHDGRWVLALTPTSPVKVSLYPTGAGSERTVDNGSLQALAVAEFFPGDTAIFLCGNTPGHGARCFSIPFAGGTLRALTPEGASPGVLSPDGREVMVGARRYIIGSDSARKVPGILASDKLLRWSADGRAVFVQADIFRLDRVDLVTGHRTVAFDVTPSPGSGIVTLDLPTISADGREVAWTAWQYLSRLFTVGGVR